MDAGYKKSIIDKTIILFLTSDICNEIWLYYHHPFTTYHPLYPDEEGRMNEYINEIEKLIVSKDTKHIILDNKYVGMIALKEYYFNHRKIHLYYRYQEPSLNLVKIQIHHLNKPSLDKSKMKIVKHLSNIVLNEALYTKLIGKCFLNLSLGGILTMDYLLYTQDEERDYIYFLAYYIAKNKLVKHGIRLEYIPCEHSWALIY